MKAKETEIEHLYNYRINLILYNFTIIFIIWLNTRGFVYTESHESIFVTYYLWSRDTFYTALVVIEESKFLLLFPKKEKYDRDTISFSPCFLSPFSIESGVTDPKDKFGRKAECTRLRPFCRTKASSSCMHSFLLSALWLTCWEQPMDPCGGIYYYPFKPDSLI